jgi:hypothetical protein
MTEPTTHRARAEPAGATAGGTPAGTWWAPGSLTWWIASLFAVGSVCFLVAPFPGFVQHFGSGVDGMVYFVGSIFFTAAAFGQLTDAITVRHAHRGARPRSWRVWRWDVEPLDFWAALVQFIGTICFNVSTGFAIDSTLDEHQVARLVWRPDVYGSIAFLVPAISPRSP